MSDPASGLGTVKPLPARVWRCQPAKAAFALQLHACLTTCGLPLAPRNAPPVRGRHVSLLAVRCCRAPRWSRGWALEALAACERTQLALASHMDTLYGLVGGGWRVEPQPACKERRQACAMLPPRLH